MDINEFESIAIEFEFEFEFDEDDDCEEDEDDEALDSMLAKACPARTISPTRT